MGTLTGALLSLMLSWVRGIVALLWRLASDGGKQLLDWFSGAWLPLSLAIIAAGLFLDRIAWLTHYSPKRFSSGRRKKGTPDVQDGKSESAQTEEEWLPEPPFEESKEPAGTSGTEVAADLVPDAELRPYPGMRYDPAFTGETRKARAVKAAEETKNICTINEDQAEYERKMEVYRREQERYERELREYERQKAAYDAANAAEAGKTAKNAELGNEGNGTEMPPHRRRRSEA
ncbi:MAG: hypothetical protein K5746_00230 [Clostridiales bacterium]|nr:hypothetical protein [Clostridiales bacterium]